MPSMEEKHAEEKEKMKDIAYIFYMYMSRHHTAQEMDRILVGMTRESMKSFNSDHRTAAHGFVAAVRKCIALFENVEELAP